MAYYEKYREILGIRPSIESAPHPINQSTYLENVEKTRNMIGESVSERSLVSNVIINSDAIEDAVLKILNKYNVYIPGAFDVSMGYSTSTPKTFTLDDIIKIIESMETRFNVNKVGIWENTTEHLIDRDKLIQKFKEA